MAFEQNQQLRRLLDPVALQQMAYDRDRNRNSLFQPPQQQQVQQFNPLQQQMGAGIQQQPIQQQSKNRGFFGNIVHGAKKFFFGEGPQQITSSQYLPYQMQGFQDQYNQGSQLMRDPEAGFNQYYNNIMSDYQNNIIPGIANQFSMTGGATSSPDFTSRLAGGLAQQYAAHRLNFGNQNWNRGFQQTQLGLTPQMQQTYVPREPGVVQQTIPLVGAVAGANYFRGL